MGSVGGESRIPGSGKKGACRGGESGAKHWDGTCRLCPTAFQGRADLARFVAGEACRFR
jgi:hypothetical protein